MGPTGDSAAADGGPGLPRHSTHSRPPSGPAPCVRPQNLVNGASNYRNAVVAVTLATGELIWGTKLGGADAWNGACMQSTPTNPHPNWCVNDLGWARGVGWGWAGCGAPRRLCHAMSV